MRNLLLLTLILSLSVSASAKPEEIVLGPYNVSFDLNTTMNYTILPHSELEKENETSSFHIDIMFDNDTRALIGIENYSQWQYAGHPCMILKKLVLELDKTTLAGNVSERMIDGKRGEVVQSIFVRSGDNKVLNSTMAVFWPDSVDAEGYSVPLGRTKVEILAVFPQNLSESLLNTIHIGISEQPGRLETMAVPQRSIAVRDQRADDPSGFVIIPEVISPDPTFLVVLDSQGNVLGYREVEGGVNENVSVKLDYSPKTDILVATLNQKADVNLPGWHHPFMPDSDYQSSRFIDQRVTMIGRKGAAWLDSDWQATSGVYAGAVNPQYSRERCMAALAANGYPESMAAFYCD